nr:PREDICTED: probable 39S ribosomal protein L45, mitochondrial isoform X1 [Bemisia tabaci]
MSIIGRNLLKVAVARPNVPLISIIPVRFRSTKHWNPKWKKLRGLKVQKLDLPDFHKDKDMKDLPNMSAEEVRSFFKERGIQPTRPWRERDMFLTCTRSIFESYVPPEGDGKVSVLSKEGVAQQLSFLKKKTNSWKAVRKIREYEDGFELYPNFVDEAQDCYIKAHQALAEKDKEKLLDYVTEYAYGAMVEGIDNKTFRWNFIKSLEAPKVVHARETSAITDNNIFAQLTVRFHTQQTLAIYDRFGRLMYGSEVVAKDVLEYVVFEKHIINVYGKWRVHDKIIPDWMPPREPLSKTQVIPSGPTQAESTPEVATAQVSTPEVATAQVSTPQEKPAVSS